MTIPKAVPGQLIPFVNTFVSHITWESASAVVSTLEASFYASLRGGVVQAGRIVNWLRETSISYIDEIQTIFNLANLGLIAISAKKLFDAAQLRYDFSIITDKIWTIKSAAISASVAGVFFFGWKMAKETPTPHLTESQTKEAEQSFFKKQRPSNLLDVSEGYSYTQKVAQRLHITKLILNIASACFVKNRFWLVVSLTTSIYSLWQNIQIKWISFTQRISLPIVNFAVPVTQLNQTYHMLELPPSQTSAKEKCGVCLDEQSAKIAFCANHVFCRPCLEKIVQEKRKDLKRINHILKTTTAHYRDHAYTHTSHDYTLTTDQKNLPHCPTCNDAPPQNGLSIEVYDQRDGIFNAKIKLNKPPVDREYLFENLYAIYSAAQAALAYLQSYPELTATIFKIQKIMLATDLIGNALTIYYLFNKVNEKYNPDNSTKFKVSAAAAIGLAGALSWYVAWQIRSFLMPAIVLNDLLKQMNLSEDVLKTVKASFNAPLAHLAMQALFINRIISSTALTFFSEQRKTSLFTVITQLASLVNISSLKWIEMTQTLTEPLKVFTTHSFAISSSCITHLQSTMKSITEFTVNLFNGSSYHKYWKVQYTNSYVTSRQLYYSFIFKNTKVEPCGCSLIPHLVDTSIQVVDASLGAVKGVANLPSNLTLAQDLLGPIIDPIRDTMGKITEVLIIYPLRKILG